MSWLNALPFFQRNSNVALLRLSELTAHLEESVYGCMLLRHSHCRVLESSGSLPYPPHCFLADSNFVGFVIKQHWRLWFLMPSLESMSEVKGHFPVERLSHSSGTEQKWGKHPNSVTLHNLPCASKGCGEILIADGEVKCPWAMASNSSHPTQVPGSARLQPSLPAMAEEGLYVTF